MFSFLWSRNLTLSNNDLVYMHSILQLKAILWLRQRSKLDVYMHCSLVIIPAYMLISVSWISQRCARLAVEASRCRWPYTLFWSFLLPSYPKWTLLHFHALWHVFFFVTSTSHFGDNTCSLSHAQQSKTEKLRRDVRPALHVTDKSRKLMRMLQKECLLRLRCLGVSKNLSKISVLRTS